jgi:hypothetical protein
VISSFDLEVGKQLLLTLPESLGAAESITLEGRILRSSYDKRIGKEGMYSAAVKFENLSSDLRNELEWIIEDKVGGPPALNTTPLSAQAGAGTKPAGAKPTYTVKRAEQRRPVRRTLLEKESAVLRSDPRSEGSARAATSNKTSKATGAEESYPLSVPVEIKMARAQSPVQEPVAEVTAPPPAAKIAQRVVPQPATSASDRRATPRHPYAAKVPAFGTRALRVLVGRDISVGGMRIESNPDLEVGDRLHLAIYGDASEEPFLVWGTILRGDGRGGTAVAFDPVHPSIAKQLERLVASLPAVESLHDDEATAMGTVLTEIVNE